MQQVIPFGVHGLPEGSGYLKPGLTIVYADRRVGLTSFLSAATRDLPHVVVYAPNARDYVHVARRECVSRKDIFRNRVVGRRPDLIVIDGPPQSFSFECFNTARGCGSALILAGEEPFEEEITRLATSTFDLRFVGDERIFYLTKYQPYSIRFTDRGLEAWPYAPGPKRTRFEIMDDLD